MTIVALITQLLQLGMLVLTEWFAAKKLEREAAERRQVEIKTQLEGLRRALAASAASDTREDADLPSLDEWEDGKPKP